MDINPHQNGKSLSEENQEIRHPTLKLCEKLADTKTVVLLLQAFRDILLRIDVEMKAKIEVGCFYAEMASKIPMKRETISYSKLTNFLHGY